MRLHIFEQKKVNEYIEDVNEAGRVLHQHHINPSRMSLTNAAAAAGASTDEVRAVMESRLRRAARHAQTSVEETTKTAIDRLEAELVA